MTRRLVFAAAMAAILFPCGRLAAAYRTALISQPEARRHGLSRAWYTQIGLDQARGRVQHVVLSQGTLFVQTDRAMLHALDAETGQTLWAVQVGSPNHPSLVPGANSALVAVVNGSYVYVLNRFNGKLLWKTQLEGAPGAGAALSEQRAYVSTVQGLIYSYELKPAKNPAEALGLVKKEISPGEETAAQKAERIESLRLRQDYVPPLACQSTGRSLVQPVVTRQEEDREYVAWPTDAGYLFVGLVDPEDERFTIKYRLQTDAGIVAQPTYLPPDPEIAGDSGVIYAVSRDGFAHAILEKTGDPLWRFSTGEPIVEPAPVIDENVYVATQPGGMYCLNAKSGAEKWWTPGVLRFLAASKTRIYAADKLQQIVVLDAKSGSRLDTLPGIALPIKLTNTETDRLYLATDTGLIQCLHEIELVKPIHHGESRKQPPKKPAAKQETLTKAGKEKPSAEKNPFAVKKPAGHAVAPRKPTTPKTPTVKRKPRVKPVPTKRPPRTRPGRKSKKPAGGANEGFGQGGGNFP
jgi:outer membrane protein assembly factor BamB